MVGTSTGAFVASQSFKNNNQTLLRLRCFHIFLSKIIHSVDAGGQTPLLAAIEAKEINTVKFQKQKQPVNKTKTEFENIVTKQDLKRVILLSRYILL